MVLIIIVVILMDNTADIPYAGHYVTLCGISTDQIHVQSAIEIEPTNEEEDNTRTSSPLLSYCLVLCNPAPESPAPYMYVTSKHLEKAWRSDGTDEDIILIRKDPHYLL